MYKQPSLQLFVRRVQGNSLIAVKMLKVFREPAKVREIGEENYAMGGFVGSELSLET